jgi:hypothetical protein
MESAMLKVTITSANVNERSGVGKVSGKPYHMRMQTAYVHTIDKEGVAAPFPEKTEVILENGTPDGKGQFLTPPQAPYAPGEYTLHPSSVYVDRDGRLACSLRLTPVKRAN